MKFHSIDELVKYLDEEYGYTTVEDFLKDYERLRELFKDLCSTVETIEYLLDL